MLSTVALKKWIMVVPQRDAANLDNLIRTMIKVASPLNMNIAQPLEM